MPEDDRLLQIKNQLFQYLKTRTFTITEPLSTECSILTTNIKKKTTPFVLAVSEFNFKKVTSLIEIDQIFIMEP